VHRDCFGLTFSSMISACLIKTPSFHSSSIISFSLFLLSSLSFFLAFLRWSLLFAHLSLSFCLSCLGRGIFGNTCLKR
jgi:hypothetical protein